MAYCLAGQFDGEPIRLIIPTGQSVIGADEHCDLKLPYPTISRRHARLDLTGQQLTIEDMGSSNGTRIDGRRIKTPASIVAGQEVRLGELRMRVQSVDEGDDELGAVTNYQPKPSESSAPQATLSPVATDRLAFEYLPPLLAKLGEGQSRIEAARLIAQTLWTGLPLAWLRLSDTGEAGALIFEAGQRDIHKLHHHDAQPYRLELATTADCMPGFQDRIFGLARALIGLIDDTNHYPIEPSREKFGWPDPPPLDPDVRATYKRGARVAGSELCVLIQGESGTGKDLLAQFIHQQAAREDGESDPTSRPGGKRPFIALNCAALPSDLLEAELFGIEKGVATGVEARAGCFERAHNGTLFLDEIGDMSLETQAKILRVLQEGELTRVGGSKPVPARPRVISATNRDIDRMVADGQFRLDLLHRIAGWEVTLPPLRQRPADIANLAVHFLAAHCQARDIRVRGISKRALDCLRHYDWPGNVRELQREMQRVSVFLGQDDLLTGKDLRPIIRDASRAQDGDSLEGQLAIAERTIIKHALARSDGNVSQAARLLNVSRSTLYRRLECLDLQDPAPES